MTMSVQEYGASMDEYIRLGGRGGEEAERQVGGVRRLVRQAATVEVLVQ
jgi:hypothetical protein